MERFRHLLVRPRGTAVALTTLAVVALGGCASSSPQSTNAERTAAMNAWTLGPLVDDEGNYRSLSLDSPPMAELIEIQPWLAVGEPWYAGRIDRSRQITAGVRRQVVERAFISTTDRVEGKDGQVKDDFKLRVSTERIIELRP